MPIPAACTSIADHKKRRPHERAFSSDLFRYIENATDAAISSAVAATSSQPTYGLSARRASDIRDAPTKVEAVYVPNDEGEKTLNLLSVAKTATANALVQIAIFSTFSPSFKR